jgi:exodeoxyribonuclease VII large subunit
MRTALRQQVELRRRRLDDLAGRRAFRLPLESVRDWEQRLDDWGERLRRAVRQRVQAAGERVASGAARLESLSPLNVLRRGYTLTRNESDQTLVRSVAQVRPGDLLRTLVTGGWILSRVEAAQEADPVAPLPQGWTPAARTQS